MTTKIIATIGPISNNAQKLLEYHNAGMDMARLNGSHATLEWHAETIKLIRQTLPSTPILLDIPGRKVRTVGLSHEPSFNVNDTIILTTDLTADHKQKTPVNYENLHEDIKAGDTILADDGTLSFTVSSVKGRDIFCKANASGTLKSKKGINVPHIKLKTELITAKDRFMIHFAKEMGVDFIGISFVESKDHVLKIKDEIAQSHPKIIAKVENQGGIQNLDEILDVSDVIMIDRGDLSVETSLEMVILNQKHISKKATEKSVPLIIATEMLHTMIDSPFPTKAEISDITNAILDKASALMLSGETAIGEYGTQAILLMKKISQNIMESTCLTNTAPQLDYESYQSISKSIKQICNTQEITKIIAITRSGFAGKVISSQQPNQEIILVTNTPEVMRESRLLFGVTPHLTREEFTTTSSDHIYRCLNELFNENKISTKDKILVAYVAYPGKGNYLNSIQVHNVEDLKSAFKWGDVNYEKTYKTA